MGLDELGWFLTQMLKVVFPLFLLMALLCFFMTMDVGFLQLMIPPGVIILLITLTIILKKKVKK